jgi:mitochondrial fission protein ELM1
MPARGTNHPEIWVLCDDRMGNTSQALGVAEALDLPFVVKKITYTKHSGLPNALRCNLSGVDEKRSDPLTAPWPDLVIAAGRRLAPVARYIKRKSRGKAKLAHIMWPGFPTFGFDLIAVPQHDRVRPRKRVLRTVGAPHRITPEILMREGKMWQKTLHHIPTPYIALLLGGNSKEGEFTVTHARQLGQMATAFAKEHGASLLITSSRRTGVEVQTALLSAIKVPYHFHDPNKVGKLNPYIAYLALSDYIIVTGDSTSMCSEACASGKPVFIYSPEGVASAKHKRFHSQLFEGGYARPFLAHADGTPFERPPQPLNTAATLALAIREQLFP